MHDNYHYSVKEWKKIADKYYKDNPPIEVKDARLIVPKKKSSKKNEDKQ